MSQRKCLCMNVWLRWRQDVGAACHLYEPWHYLGQQADQSLFGNPLHHFGLHLDGSQVDGVVS